MSLVWYAVPTAAKPEYSRPCFDAWRDMGYKVAILFEGEAQHALQADLKLCEPPYRGYGMSVNRLAKAVLEHDPDCQIVVSGGDDVYPCQTKRADKIAAEFIEHFGGTLGVMQPHGDELHHTHDGKGYILDTAAWSPWMGREWCERAFMGRGPMHPGFYHYWSSTNLQDVAVWLGLYWQRADIIQRDDNWKRSARAHLGRPPYLYKAKAMGAADYALYKRLQDEGYPECGLKPL